MEQFTRAAWLLGDGAMEKLKQSRVAVFGIGGVGGYTVEALVRSGVGAIDLIDNDVVSVSNLNRQIVALHSTVGEYKTEVMARRALDINPDCKIKTFNTFYTPDSVEFDFSSYDYVVDAVDTVSAKLAIVENAIRAGTPVISAMGAGNKLNAAAFEVADISKTSVCPPCQSGAAGIEETGHRTPESGVFQRRTRQSGIARRGGTSAGQKDRSRQRGVRAVGDGLAACRRSN